MNNRTKIICTSVFILMASSAFAERHDGSKGYGDWFSKCDTNGDGSVSKEEFITEKTKTFEKYDMNSDGKIDKAEHDKMVLDMKSKFKGNHHNDMGHEEETE